MNTVGLYEQLSSFELLQSAWLEVKAKGSAGGIDKISIDNFELVAEEQLKELASELAFETYTPKPYLQIYIHKNASEFRMLGLLSIRDKVVQEAIRFLIEPILEKTFLDVSYAYRHDKGAVKAINRVKHILEHEKKYWAVSCDLHSYFDNIPHVILFTKLREIIKDEKLVHLIELCTKMGRITGGMKWEDCKAGVPQGAVISPLLANLYLTELDALMLEKHNGFVRYADDFVVLCNTKEHAEAAYRLLQKLLIDKLKLSFNEEKKQIANISSGFDFLGIHFNEKGISLSDKKRIRLKEKIADAINFDQGALTEKFEETIQGIENYYARILHYRQLSDLDELIIAEVKSKLSKRPALVKSIAKIKLALSKLDFITEDYKRRKLQITGEIAIAVRKESKAKSTAIEDPERAIEKRKNEYQKLETQNTELVISTYGVYLGKNVNGITIKSPDEKIQKMSTLNLRHILVLSPGVTLSSDLIHHCMERGIAIDFFSRDGKHYASVHNPIQADSALWIKQLRALENGKALSANIIIIEAKIRNQLNLIKYFNKYRKRSDKLFELLFDDQTKRIDTILLELDELKDTSLEIQRGKLLSIEGRAAACYWELFAGLVHNETDFEGRERQGAKDLVNSMLNYGYAIIYSRVWDSLLRARLNPYISYLHVQQDGKPTLVYDMIEPFRAQAVDRIVISMIQKKEKLALKDGWLDDETKKKLSLNILERLHRMELYRSEHIRFADIIKQQAKDFARYINDENVHFKPYIGKW